MLTKVDDADDYNLASTQTRNAVIISADNAYTGDTMSRTLVIRKGRVSQR